MRKGLQRPRPKITSDRSYPQIRPLSAMACYACLLLEFCCIRITTRQEHHFHPFSIELAVLAVACSGPFEDTKTFKSLGIYAVCGPLFFRM